MNTITIDVISLCQTQRELSGIGDSSEGVNYDPTSSSNMLSRCPLTNKRTLSLDALAARYISL